MAIRTNISIDTHDAPNTGVVGVVVTVAAAEAGCAGEDTMASGHDID